MQEAPPAARPLHATASSGTQRQPRRQQQGQRLHGTQQQTRSRKKPLPQGGTAREERVAACGYREEALTGCAWPHAWGKGKGPAIGSIPPP